MIHLITGGSGSGKSAFAEQHILALQKDRPLYYLATMQVYDDEGRRKVERHRQARAGRGFQTIEEPVMLERAVSEVAPDACVLLECMSNLTANVMFAGAVQADCYAAAEMVLQGVRQLAQKAARLVIVTNNVFEDGIRYDDSTMEYLKALGTINCGLAQMAEQVTEVVVGIPVTVKETERRGDDRG